MATPTPNEAGWLLGMREDQQMNIHHFPESHVTNSSMPASNAAPPSTQKKKRTQPDQDAEVIALSPKTLTTTSRFICDVCNKGFQREQNLQLHRRGHSLPWKLKLKCNSNEVRKKVYVCPEPTCVHHHPSRALGDLTGIKKHFFRKHCEKKWECEKCSKRYAVQSDWKAHSKTCGSKEYRCDCGTLFSRKDSFMTHQAFCNAISQRSLVSPPNLSALPSQVFGPKSMVNGNDFRSIMPSAPLHPTSAVVLGCSPTYYEEDHDKLAFHGMIQRKDQAQSEPTDHHSFFYSTARDNYSESPAANNDDYSKISSHFFSPNVFASHQFCPNTVGGSLEGAGGASAGLLYSENMMSDDQISQSLYTSAVSHRNSNNAASSSHLSATALLQKAAQVGSSCSNSRSTSLIIRTLESSMKHDIHPLLAGVTSFNTLQNHKHPQDGWLTSDRGIGSITSSGELYTTNGAVLPMLGFEKLAEHEPQMLLNGNSSGGGCDRLTRDFLGVGLIVRQMSGGFSQNDHLLQNHQGHQMSSRTAMGGGDFSSP